MARTAESSPTEDPPIDLIHLAKYTCGNAELEQEVLSLFVDQLPALLSQLATCATDKAWHDAAHTLKGSARAVGARKLGDFAEAAEAAAPPQRQDAVDAIKSEIARVCGYVDFIVADA